MFSSGLRFLGVGQSKDNFVELILFHLYLVWLMSLVASAFNPLTHFTGLTPDSSGSGSGVGVVSLFDLFWFLVLEGAHFFSRVSLIQIIGMWFLFCLFFFRESSPETALLVPHSFCCGCFCFLWFVLRRGLR